MNDFPIIILFPFILMLLSISLLPIYKKNFWSQHRNILLISILLSIPAITWLLYSGFENKLIHTLIFDYIPFIILLGSLYIITGGIFLNGNLEAKPIVNTSFLATGAVLASFMGTTGASMLLIRSLIHTNKKRKHKTHIIIFFIFIVSNSAGLLTPLGDPPLFILYLRGIPFDWFLNLFPEWLFVNSLLLIIFFIIDKFFWNKETEDVRRIEHNYQRNNYQRKLKLEGKLNFIWLIGVILSVNFINSNNFSIFNEYSYLSFIREFLILIMVALSLILTSHNTRTSNNFSWKPIREVAYIFLGIFITMIPCILFLEKYSIDIGIKNIGINYSTLLYYSTGGLSSILDNTPTALSFYSLTESMIKSNSNLIFSNGITEKLINGIPENLIKSIALGSVLFGSMTYIGNGPNFMVKSIAEDSNINMPHFFEYIFKYSILILLPIFILTQLIFL